MILHTDTSLLSCNMTPFAVFEHCNYIFYFHFISFKINTNYFPRYVSAPEAFWRLSEYKMHFHTHTIIRLPVHLPLQQPVYFKEGEEERALQRASQQNTQLTAWFQLNSEDSSARQYTYAQIPNHYTFHSQTKKWQTRKQRGDKAISRLYSVSPKDKDRYYLRMLLLHVPGATCYDDLKTVNEQTYPSYKDACKALNLLIDDTEWNSALTEAANFQMPSQLRSLFATICIHCEPTDPSQLWETHKDAMIEDYVNLQHLTTEEATNKALLDIQTILFQAGIYFLTVCLTSMTYI